MAAKRLAAEWADLEANPDEKDRFFGESKINDLKWTMRLMIDDDADCCYAGGCYELELTFPIEYPFKMPHPRFCNPPPFHPCIHQENGEPELFPMDAWKMLDINSFDVVEERLRNVVIGCDEIGTCEDKF